MYRTLRLFLLLSALATLQANASVDRLTALGGLSQALLDDSNGFVFPASLGEWPRFEVELFDDWAGVAFPLSTRHTLGLFLNRPSPDVADLTSYIQQSGSDLFRALSPSPWLDLAYNYAPSNAVALGLATSLAYDRSSLDARVASATNADLRLGLRLGSGPTLDIGLGILLRRLQDQTLAGVEHHQTDGMGLSLDIRYRWPLTNRLTLLPYLGLGRDAYALAPEERTRTSLRLGTGLQLVPARGVLVVAALDTRFERTERAQAAQALAEEQILQLPTWILGGEVQVGSMLFRLGVRHQTQLADRERLRANQWVQSSSFTTNFTTHLGLGLEFADLLLDGLLERDFLRDGPHFLGGSRHGGGILSHLSLTYRFHPPSE